MTLIPWRVMHFLSDHFPLLYHLARNAGTRGNDIHHWDDWLSRTWDDASRIWPTKNELLVSLTSPEDAILDIGCGTGSMLRHLKGLGYQRLHGLDISRYAIRRLAAEGIEMHYGKLPSIPLPDATFDVVIASQVLEHIVRRGRFLGEIWRVLRPGGRALIFVPDDCLGPIDETEHVVKFNARSLRKLLATRFYVERLDSMRDANHPMQVLFAHVEKRAQ